MSGLWCEHFQEYANQSQMLDGVFAQVDSWTPVTAAPLPRPGATWLQASGPTSAPAWRRIFGGPKSGAGFGFRYYLSSLPPIDNEATLGAFLTAGGIAQMSCLLGSDGGLLFYRGGVNTTLTLVHRTPPCITARTWQYVELKCVPSPSGGSFEVRVNGVTVGSYTGNTDPQAAGEVSQAYAQAFGGSFAVFGYADLHAWDTTNDGNGPSDFVGNVGVLRRELNADTATADWAKSTGSVGYSLLIDDNDATFISATTSGKKSAFQAGSLPAGTSGILYQQVKFRGQKTDSADCDVAPSIISSASETAVTGQHMTTLETWRWGIFGTDPATSAPWTLSGANASDPAVTRTL
jgi:hypothetical protein